jgi:hypothetical protein
MGQKGYIELDFHGYTVEDALSSVESIINEVRMSGDAVECYFITGHGKIKTALIDMLSTFYELQPVVPLANRGVVTVYIY